MKILRSPLLACAVLLGGCDSTTPASPRAAPPAARSAAPRAPVQLERHKPAEVAPRADAVVANVFAATSWQPPPAPPPAPPEAPSAAAAPAAPVAPPLPFRYIGRYGDADAQIVMLVKGDQLYLVAVGDTIDNAYRIERVSGTMVELTYLPLNLKQSLSTGGAG